MWDPEYCDSELGAVEDSGESRDELCPSKDTAETQSQVDGGARVSCPYLNRLSLTGSRRLNAHIWRLAN